MCCISAPRCHSTAISSARCSICWQWTASRTAATPKPPRNAAAGRLPHGSANGCAETPVRLARRFEAQDAPVALVEQIEGAVRPLPHVTDAGTEIFQQAVFGDDPLAIHLQPQQHLPAQRADEQVALPLRERLAR